MIGDDAHNELNSELDLAAINSGLQRHKLAVSRTEAVKKRSHRDLM